MSPNTWQNYTNATSVEEVVEILAEHGKRARIIAGGTDLILEIERGAREGIDTTQAQAESAYRDHPLGTLDNAALSGRFAGRRAVDDS